MSTPGSRGTLFLKGTRGLVAPVQELKAPRLDTAEGLFQVHRGFAPLPQVADPEELRDLVVLLHPELLSGGEPDGLEALWVFSEDLEDLCDFCPVL